MANEPQDAMSVMVGTEEIIDVSILEGSLFYKRISTTQD
jgi:hypothetical protein